MEKIVGLIQLDSFVQCGNAETLLQIRSILTKVQQVGNRLLSFASNLIHRSLLFTQSVRNQNQELFMSHNHKKRNEADAH